LTYYNYLKDIIQFNIIFDYISYFCCGAPDVGGRVWTTSLFKHKHRQCFQKLNACLKIQWWDPWKPTAGPLSMRLLVFKKLALVLEQFGPLLDTPT
jgi:hypothetical protein